MKLRYDVRAGRLLLNRGERKLRLDRCNFVVAPLARLITETNPRAIHVAVGPDGLTTFFLAKGIWHSRVTSARVTVGVPVRWAECEAVSYLLSKTFGDTLRSVGRRDMRWGTVLSFVLQRDLREWPVEMSFNLITDGRSRERIRRAIESIRRAHMTSYEINLVGPSHLQTEWRETYGGSDLRLVADDGIYGEDARFPIARKKNLAIAHSLGRIVVLMHDRIWLSEGWYQRLQLHDGAFDLYGCRVSAPDGIRYLDKVGVDWDGYLFRGRRMYYLGYGETNVGQYVDGGFLVLNMEQTAAVPFDERLHWMEIEDVDFAAAQRLFGNAVTFDRCNQVYSDFTGHFHLQRRPWAIVKKMYLRRTQLGAVLQRTRRALFGR